MCYFDFFSNEKYVIWNHCYPHKLVNSCCCIMKYMIFFLFFFHLSNFGLCGKRTHWQFFEATPSSVISSGGNSSVGHSSLQCYWTLVSHKQSIYSTCLGIYTPPLNTHCSFLKYCFCKHSCSYIQIMSSSHPICWHSLYYIWFLVDPFSLHHTKVTLYGLLVLSPIVWSGPCFHDLFWDLLSWLCPWEFLWWKYCLSSSFRWKLWLRAPPWPP